MLIEVRFTPNKVNCTPSSSDARRTAVRDWSMITARQIRAGRALLGWSQQELADRAIVSTNAVNRLERGLVDSRTSTLAAVQKALLRGGIEFIPADVKGEGVRLSQPSKEAS